MDITLENIDTLELPADLEAKLLDKLSPKASDYLTGKGHVVKLKADYDTEVNTVRETAIAKGKADALKEETAAVWNGSDSLIGLALGLQKPNGMKTYDWFKQLETEGKFPLSKEAQDKLKAAMKGENSETKNALAEALKQELADYKAAQTQKDAASFKKVVNAAIVSDLRTAPLLIDPALTDAGAIATAKAKAISDLKDIVDMLFEAKEDEEGNLYFVKKGTTTAMMNTAESRPMTATEIIKATYPQMLNPTGHQQQGLNTKKVPTPGVYTTLPEILYAATKEKGFAAYSKEWHEFVNTEKKKAGIK